LPPEASCAPGEAADQSRWTRFPLRRGASPFTARPPPTLKRLAKAGIDPSVGSKADSYDNALAESVIGLFKMDVIHRRVPWRILEDVEFATLE
jgi:transposase InsO family protein